MAYVVQSDIQIVLARPTRPEVGPDHVEDIRTLVGVERGVPGSDSPPYPTTGTYIPVFRLYRTPLTESDFGLEDSLVGTTVPLIWVELALADGTYVYAKVDLPDPASYYGGWKEGRLLTVGGVKRALSDRLGNYEAAQFSFTLTDHDRFVRAKLGGAATKWFMNRFVTMRMISDEGRRNLLVPRIIAIGYLRDYAPVSPLQFVITCEDYLALFVGLGENEKQIPKRTINRIDFPDAPLAQVGKPVPIVYGVVSDETSTSTPPVITGTFSLGSYIQDGFRLAAFGPTGVLSAPTGVAIAQNGAASGAVAIDVPNGEWGAIVTAVDAGGNESDPSAYYWDAENGGRGSFSGAGLVATVTPSDATRSLTVTWNAVGGAVKYRVYLGWYYYGARWNQVIEVTAPTVSATFDKAPVWSTEPNTGNISTGAGLVYFQERHQYRVAAVMVDGETALSVATTSAWSRPYRRPVRVEWVGVAGAVEYRVYRFDQFGNFEGRRWTVAGGATYFDDDLLDTNVELLTEIPAATGAVPLIPVGTEVDAGGARWYRFLVAGHAVKAVDSVFLDGRKVDAGNFGVTWAVPGKTGYSTYFPNTGSPQYRDLNGHRYTLVYVRGPDGDAAASGTKITANLQGIEDAGDGGGSLIQDGFDQYLHAMRNWILGDYQSGAWPTAGPTWPSAFGAAAVEVLDDLAFADAKAIAQERIAGGYQGNFILGANGELQTTRAWIQRFNVSLDCYCGFSRKSQYFIRMLDPDLDVLAAARKYTQVLDIYEGSFQVVDQVGNLENVIVYSYWRNYADNRWLKDSLETPDTDSITNSQQTKRSQTLELWLHRSQTSADDVVNRRLLRTKEPPRLVTFRTGLQALNTELGDIVKVTHIEGVGVNGWTDRAIFITRHELDPDRLSIVLEGYDVDRLFEGAFILGDEGVLPADWDDTDPTEAQYGYLADETTGEFTNGDPIKRLR